MKIALFGTGFIGSKLITQNTISFDYDNSLESSLIPINYQPLTNFKKVSNFLSFENIHYNYNLINYNPEIIEIIKDCDVIIHTANIVGVKNQTQESFYINRTINNNILKYRDEIQKKYNKFIKIVFFSTSEIYGNYEKISSIKGFTEKDNFYIQNSVRGLYSLEKLYFEKVLTNKDLIIRPFNIVGNTQDYNKGVFSNFVKKAKENKSLIVYPGIRSYCYIDDFVDALKFLIKNNYTGAYNIGNPENTISNKDLAIKIIYYFKSKSKYILKHNLDFLDEYGFKDIENRVANIDKLRKIYKKEFKSLDEILKTF